MEECIMAKNKNLKEVKKMEKMVEGAANELRSDWLDLSASCRDDAERERWEKLLFPKPLTVEQMHEFCAVIKENVRLGVKGNVIVNLATRRQTSEGNDFPIIGDAYVSLQRKGVDLSGSFVLRENELRNVLIFIGSNATGMTRGFVMSKDIAGEVSELSEFRMYAISKDPTNSHAIGMEISFWVEEYRKLDIGISMDVAHTEALIADMAENDEGYGDSYIQTAPLLQDVIDPATTARYDSLGEGEYFDSMFKDMKALFSKCDFRSRKNEPKEIHGSVGTPINSLYWPAIPSQPFNIDKDTTMCTGTKINFRTPNHFMVAQHEGSFHITNAVIRAKFAGDESHHTFYIGEHDQPIATVLIGHDADDSLVAIMIDGRIPLSAREDITKMSETGTLDRVMIQHDVAELEEFYMLAVTDGRYYKNYMKPRAVNEDLAIFTCYNKARKLSCDTVASFTKGLCDPETIFTDTGAEDVRAF